ncbi:hypothetical protein JW766_06335 [Candidatus Dojkabacteria bacterium]|nr:hypothetical protein [Candidatus Dojkabacteria bacterium]
MDNQTTYFQNYHDLLIKLTTAFSDLQPEELRDILFFLKDFENNNKIPNDIVIYASTLPIEGLEVTSEDKVSQILVGGIEKYIDLKYPKKSLPPVVVLKGGVRNIIIYGEIFAMEAFIRKTPVKAIVLDLEERDVFEVFELNEMTPKFLVPLVKEILET